MKYTKTSGISGAWVKSSEVVSGTKAKLITEVTPQEGEFGTQDVAKIRFQGDTGEAKNVRINKPSINALVTAYGEDSKSWIGQVLTAHTEKMIVGGKRVTALYLVPEGFEVGEDDGGYIVVRPIIKQENKETTNEVKDEINPDDIPF